MNHLDDAATRIAAELRNGIVVIDGPSGSGKSTFADRLTEAVWARGVGAVLVRTDDFATWDNPVGWWPEFEAEILKSFERGHDYRYHPMVWRGGVPERGPRVWLRWEPLLVIEGVSSARSAMAGRADRALWIDGGTAGQRLERAVARDGETERDHLRRWQDFEAGWFAIDRTRERCEVLELPTAQ
ncbi:uridine kinase [Williamsia sp. CHRR-6]|uniref:uridine kinase family protein n=1 Tax=Williamsia sp. CHRR-6 TaxID=2835871 RepID=UPI001BDAC2F7|nr:hypothetical protein [Williamsia sp. CHRR-6]MBT0567217.1 hypothetical protein [Williamsia sp. CHRR-6]